MVFIDIFPITKSNNSKNVFPYKFFIRKILINLGDELNNNLWRTILLLLSSSAESSINKQ